MSQKIICFGDSNTYGYDARSMFGDRLAPQDRWVDIVAASSGWTMLNYGENGREIPCDEWDYKDVDTLLCEHTPFDLMTVMLGTNDLLMMYRSGMSKVAARMEDFIKHLLNHPSLSGHPEKILLIAPTKTSLGRYGTQEARYDEMSAQFSKYYQAIAIQYGTHFTNADTWELPLAHDGVHLTPEAHRIFAEKIQTVIAHIL